MWGSLLKKEPSLWTLSISFAEDTGTENLTKIKPLVIDTQWTGR
jgi:hypothetical protein